MPRHTSPVSTGPPAAVSVSTDVHGRTVIWVRGEHDLSTVDDLGAAAASAAAAGEGEVIFDLRHASFIDASTVVALARARVLLRSGGRDISIRSPSRLARFVIDVCGQSDRIDRHDHRNDGRDRDVAVPSLVAPNGNEPR